MSKNSKGEGGGDIDSRNVWTNKFDIFKYTIRVEHRFTTEDPNDFG